MAKENARMTEPVLENLVFGPVPSRRLGRCMGINHIPAKYCTYACAYCQVGKTMVHVAVRHEFHKPSSIADEVKRKLAALRSRGEEVDYLVFVPDGESTLDARLGETIALLKRFGVPVAVITNASLIWRDDVVKDLSRADVVSVKVDAVHRATWQKINRPCTELSIETILQGIKAFSSTYPGRLLSETMIIDRASSIEDVQEVAAFLATLPKLDKAFISVPTRPPAELWVKPADPDFMKAVYAAFVNELGVDRVEVLDRYEGNKFISTGDPGQDLLAIIAVHPMRERAAIEFLSRDGKAHAHANGSIAGSPRDQLDDMVHQGLIEKKEYQGIVYVRRVFHSNDTR